MRHNFGLFVIIAALVSNLYPGKLYQRRKTEQGRGMKVTHLLAHRSPSEEKPYSGSRLVRVGPVLALSLPLRLP